MGKRIQVEPGDRYGRWTVVCEAEPRISPANGQSHRMVECYCECGTTRQVLLASLRTANGSASCGCLQRERARQSGRSNRTHGMADSPTYCSWSQMKQRCLNPNDVCYHRYGGRGIQVCQRWLDSFEAFLEDMGERPEGHCIERIDNNIGYEPGNCVWATNTEQARNRVNNVMLTFQGKTMCISAWAEHIGLPRKALEKRLNHHGFTVEEALTLPLHARRVSR